MRGARLLPPGIFFEQSLCCQHRDEPAIPPATNWGTSAVWFLERASLRTRSTFLEKCPKLPPLWHTPGARGHTGSARASRASASRDPPPRRVVNPAREKETGCSLTWSRSKRTNQARVADLPRCTHRLWTGTKSERSKQRRN